MLLSGGGADRAWRTTNTGRLLFNATDRCVRIKLRAVHKAGFGDVSEAQMALYHHLDRGGTRLTTLAERAGITKPSMTELVTRGVKQGLIVRTPDLADARAKIISSSARGAAMLDALHAGMRAAETHIAAIVGAASLGETRTSLSRFVSATHEAAKLPDHADASWRADTIGRLFALSARGFARIVVRHVAAHGHDDVGEALLALFRNLDLSGTRLTDIAARARMTKQAMREQVDRAEALGLVVRAPDTADSRAKLIRLTAKGLAALDVMRDGVATAEAQLDAVIGDAAVARLRLALTAVERAA